MESRWQRVLPGWRSILPIQINPNYTWHWIEFSVGICLGPILLMVGIVIGSEIARLVKKTRKVGDADTD